MKSQGSLDFTDFGFDKDGKDDRLDLDLCRARIALIGMLNDTWGIMFQTCCTSSTTPNSWGGG